MLQFDCYPLQRANRGIKLAFENEYYSYMVTKQCFRRTILQLNTSSHTLQFVKPNPKPTPIKQNPYIPMVWKRATFPEGLFYESKGEKHYTKRFVQNSPSSLHKAVQKIPPCISYSMIRKRYLGLVNICTNHTGSLRLHTLRYYMDWYCTHLFVTLPFIIYEIISAHVNRNCFQISSWFHQHILTKVIPSNQLWNSHCHCSKNEQ